MSFPYNSAAVAAGASMPPRKKRQRCNFAPGDDQKLRACTSRVELLNAIAAIVRESDFSRRSVVTRAKELGVWDKFAAQKARDDVSILRLLRNSSPEQDPLTAIAGKLHITKTAARLRIYRDEDCLECLTDGTYSLREVAEGFCMRQSTVSAMIQSGLLRAKRLQRRGKLRIPSDAIVDFVRTYPRHIPWDRCLRKSSWLRDILETTRCQQVAALLCVSPKTLRSWIERGIFQCRFDPLRGGELFSDEPIYRFFDEYPDLIDLPKCRAKNPEWFARYEVVRGRYPRQAQPGTNKLRATDRQADFPSVRILLRRG
jgi:transposase